MLVYEARAIQVPVSAWHAACKNEFRATLMFSISSHSWGSRIARMAFTATSPNFTTFLNQRVPVLGFRKKNPVILCAFLCDRGTSLSPSTRSTPTMVGYDTYGVWDGATPTCRAMLYYTSAMDASKANADSSRTRLFLMMLSIATLENPLWDYQ